MKAINLNHRVDVVNEIKANIAEDLAYFGTTEEKLAFADATLKNNPFGVSAAINGVGYKSIKALKIKAKELVWNCKKQQQDGAANVKVQVAPANLKNQQP